MQPRPEGKQGEDNDECDTQRNKDSVAIAIRSLKDRFVTIVSLTLVLI